MSCDQEGTSLDFIFQNGPREKRLRKMSSFSDPYHRSDCSDSVPCSPSVPFSFLEEAALVAKRLFPSAIVRLYMYKHPRNPGLFVDPCPHGSNLSDSRWEMEQLTFALNGLAWNYFRSRGTIVLVLPPFSMEEGHMFGFRARPDCDDDRRIWQTMFSSFFTVDPCFFVDKLFWAGRRKLEKEYERRALCWHASQFNPPLSHDSPPEPVQHALPFRKGKWSEPSRARSYMYTLLLESINTVSVDKRKAINFPREKELTPLSRTANTCRFSLCVVLPFLLYWGASSFARNKH
mmetsp:Transcript_5900/g.14102  ORF Transcript_5900/g.14102 Transcript_5900/m.14102 type:complete len:290 (-) Transcript_5900:5950-6819(-)